MTAPTYADAYQFARAEREKNGIPAANKLMARLLWHVRAEHGGFIGLTDRQIAAKVKADPRLNQADVDEAMWAPGEWPSQSFLTLPTRTEEEARAARSAA